MEQKGGGCVEATYVSVKPFLNYVNSVIWRVDVMYCCEHQITALISFY